MTTRCWPLAAAVKAFGDAVGKALAIVEARHCISSGEHRGATLLLGPHLGFMLEIDIPAPAEQDQRDVERQRGTGDPDLRAEIASPMRICVKNVLPFQISSITAVIRTMRRAHRAAH